MKKNSLNLLVLLMASSIITACNNKQVESESVSKQEESVSEKVSEQSEEKKSEEELSSMNTPVQLDEVEDLLVVRKDADNMVVRFTKNDFADFYTVQVEKGDVLVLAEQEIEVGGLIPSFDEEGTYVVMVWAKTNGTDYISSEFATFEYNVEKWVERLDENNCKWTVTIEQGIPYGTTTLLYPDGTVFSGTITSDFKLEEGTFTYPNKMNYVGKFEENVFSDKNGKFSWSTTGNDRDGNTYVGAFKNGTTDGQVGTMTLPAYYTNGNGIQYFTGKMSGMCWAGNNEKYFGKINYGGQYYEGDLVYVANDFHRIGSGENIWTSNESASWFAGYTNTTSAILTDKYFDRYIGEFDDYNHAWFYGKGVVYLKNADGTPYGYVYGIWDWKAGSLTKWDDFDKDTLLEAYKAENVLDLTKNFN